MAHIIENLVEQGSTSTGATTIALTIDPTLPCRAFADVMSNGDTTEAMVINTDNPSEWQAAIYAYAAGVLTFQELIDSPTGVAISFGAGLKRVYIAPLAGQRPALTARGEWNSGTEYDVNDSVSRDGASYVSRVGDNLNNQPESSPTQWQLLAAQGEPGDVSGLPEIEAAVAAFPVQADSATLDPDGAALVTRSPDGREIERVSADGEVLLYGAEEAPVAWLDADTGEVKAVGGALDGVEVLLSADLATSLRSEVFTRAQGGFRAPFDFIGGGVHVGRIGRGVIVPDDGKTLHVVIFVGQSNHSGSGEEPLRPAHPYPARLLIPNRDGYGDIRLYLNQLGDEALVGTDISGFASLTGATTYGGGGGTCQSEIAMSTLARLIGEACDGWIPPLCGYTIWKGGTSVADMEPAGGSNVNANVRTAGAAIVREAAELGYKVNFLACCIDQGENDTGNATLASQWVAIVDGFNTYLQGLTGQTNDIVPLINLTSSFSTATGERSKIDRYKSDGDLIVAAPRYMIGAEAWNADDYLHMTATGHFRLGEAVGHALFGHLCQGGYVPFHAIGATMTSGSDTVTLTLSEPPAIDTDLVASIDQSGLRIRKSSPSGDLVTISDIAVVGSTLVLTLAESLSSGTSPAPVIGIGIAGQNTPRDAAGINRTNIRSAAELGRSQLDGRPIHRWLAHDFLTITYV